MEVVMRAKTLVIVFAVIILAGLAAQMIGA